ncbi:MAG: lipopolysaccharide biosynthesis protein [Eubacteriales bacterium]
MRKLQKEKSNMTIKKATYMNAFSKYSVVILNLFFTSILARVLSPQDYGIVAVVMVFSTFFMMVAEMGLGAAVIQNKELSSGNEDGIYTATLYLGVLFGVLFALCSFVFVRLYENQAYYFVGVLLAIYLMLSIFNIVPQAILLKERLFQVIAVRSIITCCLSYGVAIVVAFLGGKYYAILAQMIVNIAIVFLWNWKKSNLKISKQGMVDSVKLVLNFTVFQSLFNFVTYFARNLDNLLVGYVMGDNQLGLYNKSYQLMRYPVSILSTVITPTLLPMLNDRQSEREFVFRQYNKIVRILMILGIYVSVFCFYASEEIILIMFGEQWEGATGAFHWFSAGIILQLIVDVRGSMYQIFGETKKLSSAGIIESFLIVVAICIGVATRNIEQLSICYLIGFLFYFLHCQYRLAKDCFHIPVKRMFQPYKVPSILYMILFLVMYFVPSLNNVLWSVVVKGIVLGVIYIALLIITNEIKYIWVMFPSNMKKIE